MYLQDGRLPIDNNDVERDHRRVAIGRKNWLFLGSEDAGDRTATILTIVGSAHRHDLDVWAYLRDVLERLARGTTDLEALLPDVWKAARTRNTFVHSGSRRSRSVPMPAATGGQVAGNSNARRNLRIDLFDRESSPLF